MRITITLPRVQADQLASNLIGVVGLLGLVVAIGGLTGNWWWSLAAGSVIAVGVAWVANTHAQAAAKARQTPPAAADGEAPALRVAGKLSATTPAASSRPA